MADIILKCSECGRENKASEYASPETLVCASCHRPLRPLEQGKKSFRLRMRRIESQEAKTLTGETAAYVLEEKVRRESAAAAAAVLGDVHKEREKVKRPNAFCGYLTFLIAGGTLIGLQYLMEQRPDLLQTYQWARIGITAIGTILLLTVAFQDSLFQGLLCLFILPYTIYYAAVRLESYWIRGAFIGVIVALCAELYFMPNEAVIVRAQKNITMFIDNTGRLIDKASASPERLH